MRPYSPRQDLSFRLTSLLREKQPDKVESGSYLVGCDSKAAFWFWEINYDKRTYHDFRCANYVEGEKVYHAERFDLWREYQ